MVNGSSNNPPTGVKECCKIPPSVSLEITSPCIRLRSEYALILLLLSDAAYAFESICQ